VKKKLEKAELSAFAPVRGRSRRKNLEPYVVDGECAPKSRTHKGGVAKRGSGECKTRRH